MTGAPEEAVWRRAEPRRELPAPVIDRILDAALPGSRAVEIMPLAEGMRNANFKLRIDRQTTPLVLRLYEHDASLCQKEADILRMVRRAVPVPEVRYAAPAGLEDIAPFAILEFVEGITFRELRRSGDADAIAQAAFSAGETLAAIGRWSLPKPGWLGPGPEVGAPLLEGADPTPRFVDHCLVDPRLRERLPENLWARIHAFIWERAAAFDVMDREFRLVHGDFNRRNIIVRPVDGRWRVRAVVDWEFAISSTPLIDLGNFLRYEREASPVAEPDFSRGYREGGGELPRDWRRMARWVNLASICESLTHEYLPDDAAAELVEMVVATVEDRDPRFA